MINRFALSFLCIELDRNEIVRFFGLYILLIDTPNTNIAEVVQQLATSIAKQTEKHPRISSPTRALKKN